MKVSYKRLPLATAVLSVLALQTAYAEEAQPHVELEALEINVDRQGTKVKTNVVTLQEKDESTATNLRGLLRTEPSIDFSAGQGASQFITIRGMGQNSIDVKVDNAYSDSQMFYHQGRFTLDPSLVKIVSVQKGAGSASAGIGATNGAIVAKTVSAEDLLQDGKDWGVKVNAGFSSNKEQSAGITLFGKADNFDVLVATNHVNRENYKAGKGSEVMFGSKTVPFSASDKESHLYKMGYNLGDHRFVLSHFKDTDKGTRYIREEFPAYAQSYLDTLPASSPVRRLTESNQAPEYRELVTTNTNLEWTGQNLGFVSDATANAYVMKNARISAGDNNGYGRLAQRNTTEIITKGANLNLDSNITQNTLLKYGLNYRHQEVEPNVTGRSVANTEKTDTGIYAEAIHDIGAFTLTGGLRYDHFNYTAVTGKKASDSSISPSVGVIWQATPTLSFNASHNHATRSPRLVDAFLVSTRASNISIADGIKSERAKNSEIGFNYNNGKFFANGGVFHQKIDNLINSGRTSHPNPDGTISVGTAVDNVGYAKNKGWELNAGYKHQNLTAHIGVADSEPEFYTDAGKTTNGTDPIAFTNREYGAKMGRIWTAGLAYRFAQPNVEVGVNHRRADKVTGIAWKSGGENTSVRDGYNTTDIYANWKPYGTDRMNVNFAVNNVGDKLYRPHGSVGLPAEGREFRMGVNFTY